MADQVLGTNATAITSTTQRTIVAAAATGKAHFLKRLIFTQATSGQTPLITIRTITGLVTIATAILTQETFVMEFDRELELASGDGIEGLASSSTGSVTVTAHGRTSPATT